MRHASPDDLVRLISPGETLFIPGASGAPTGFLEALTTLPGSPPDLTIHTSFVPGINNLDIDRLDPTVRVSGLFEVASWNGARGTGRYDPLPFSYAGYARHLRENMVFDTAIIQVSPPDSKGFCTLGPCVEFVPTAMIKSRRVLALINRRVPSLPNGPRLPLSSLDGVCEVDAPLPTYACDIDPTTTAVAENVATLIDDGAALQMGLGKVPMALSLALTNHRRLRLHSGLLSDGMLALAERGALDPDFPHTGCAVVGSTALYDALVALRWLHLKGCDFTHDLGVMRNVEGLVAVNSALEVDLFGQCNLEYADERGVSGAGGAPDFARGARISPNGKSVIALNATARGGASSRIVSCLSPPHVASLSRTDVDFVVTEYGAAELTGKGADARADALIQVAAPAHRDRLQAEWRRFKGR